MLDEWIRRGQDSGEDSWAWLKGKKSRYIMVIMICLGLLALLWPVSRVEKAAVPLAGNEKLLTEGSVKAQLTAELESILAAIDGAGRVEVCLTLSSEGVKSYASNRRDEKRETEESEAREIKKKSREENIVQDLAVSSGAPLLIEEKFPKVLGVLVVADGANQKVVQEELSDATATLLNIPVHKVRVMPRKGESR
ncbi:MAG: hypothetical protein PHX14_03930 [Syntrophomonadaceae bacterium]|nr:hypothetical protein [Syntrophomonadaceae bacterium]